MASRNVHKSEINSRLLKKYGSWLYCTSCNKTVAYICYVTYKWIKIDFTCKCGSKGSLSLVEDKSVGKEMVDNGDELVFVNNRYCCQKDDDPIFSVVTKQVLAFSYQGACLKCNCSFSGFISSTAPNITSSTC